MKSERILSILNQNQNLINRFVDLGFCTDRVYDSRHRWFYSLIDKDAIKKILPFILREDLEAHINLYIIEQLTHYKGSDEAFSAYLKKGLAWCVRDYLTPLMRYYEILEDYSPDRKVSFIQTSNVTLNWLISSSNQLLTSYEKYIVYLWLHKCYTINEIASIVFQERSSVRDTMQHIELKIGETYDQ